MVAVQQQGCILLPSAASLNYVPKMLVHDKNFMGSLLQNPSFCACSNSVDLIRLSGNDVASHRSQSQSYLPALARLASSSNSRLTPAAPPPVLSSSTTATAHVPACALDPMTWLSYPGKRCGGRGGGREGARR